MLVIAVLVLRQYEGLDADNVINPTKSNQVAYNTFITSVVYLVIAILCASRFLYLQRQKKMRHSSAPFVRQEDDDTM